jgi:hypothetical protein
VELLFTWLKYYHKVSQRSETLATAQGPAHAKDYAIKPLHYLLRFLLRSFSPYVEKTLALTSLLRHSQTISFN